MRPVGVRHDRLLVGVGRGCLRRLCRNGRFRYRHGRLSRADTFDESRFPPQKCDVSILDLLHVGRRDMESARLLESLAGSRSDADKPLEVLRGPKRRPVFWCSPVNMLITRSMRDKAVDARPQPGLLRIKVPIHIAELKA
jgi:hypothetical protein